jgi:hypothetical protein
VRNTLAASALFAIIGTSSFACSAEHYGSVSNAISEVTRDLVAHDASNLGKVLNVMQASAVVEYHAGSSEAACARPLATLAALIELSETLNAEKSAMLLDES